MIASAYVLTRGVEGRGWVMTYRLNCKGIVGFKA
jgi:hypothetical protein